LDFFASQPDCDLYVSDKTSFIVPLSPDRFEVSRHSDRLVILSVLRFHSWPRADPPFSPVSVLPLYRNGLPRGLPTPLGTLSRRVVFTFPSIRCSSGLSFPSLPFPRFVIFCFCWSPLFKFSLDPPCTDRLPIDGIFWKEQRVAPLGFLVRFSPSRRVQVLLCGSKKCS